jgi:hypothetical protein
LELDEKSLHTLSCDIAVRPRDAAGISHLAPFICKVEANDSEVIVESKKTGKESVESFVAAERLCCTGLTWTVEDGEDVLRLIISGTAEQMSVVKEWFVID